MKTPVLKILSGLVLFSSMLFSQWVNVSPPAGDTTFFAINVASANVVYAARGSHGMIIKSTNGGANWTDVTNPSTQGVYRIQFLNETTGFIAAGSGSYKTTNGGSSWISLITTDGFVDLCFLNENTGYLISGNSPAKIYRTTNGGANFSFVSIIAYPNHFGAGLAVVNQQAVYALINRPAVDSAVILKNINWDSSWVTVYKTKPICYDISFADANTGVVCGFLGALKRTSNGGAAWDNVNPGGAIIFQSIQLNNTASGYLVGNTGTIFKTTNSGLNWVLQGSGVSVFFNDVSVLSADNIGYVAGESGTILKTTNGGITFHGQSTSEIPNEFSLSQNYPNPFNPVTTIEFDVPVSGNVSLKVFDLTGKLVSVLADGEILAGKYKVIFNASELSSGTYFCRLNGDGFTDIKKMILIK